METYSFETVVSGLKRKMKVFRDQLCTFKKPYISGDWHFSLKFLMTTGKRCGLTAKKIMLQFSIISKFSCVVRQFISLNLPRLRSLGADTKILAAGIRPEDTNPLTKAVAI